MSAETLRPVLSPEIVSLIKSYSPIGFDLDGVIVNLAPRAIKHYNLLHGGNYTIADLDDVWRMTDWYCQKYGCTKEQALEDTKLVWNSKECIEEADPLEGALETLDLLDSVGIEHYFITSRPFSTFEFTTNWFNNHRKEALTKLLLQTSTEYNPRFKVDTIRNYGIKVHFEDMPEHALAIAENTGALVILVNHLHNRGFVSNHPQIIRPTGVHTETNIEHSFTRLVEYLQENNLR